MMESLGAAYTPKTSKALQMPMQPQGKYLMPAIGGGRMPRPTLPTMGGVLQPIGGGMPRGGTPPIYGGGGGGQMGGVVKSPRGGSPPWGQSGPGQGGMIPAPMPKQGGGIMNPRPTKGGMSGVFHPLGSAPTMKGPMRGRKF